MNFFIFSLLMICYFFSLGMSMLTSYFVIKNHEIYKTKLMTILVLLCINTFGIIYSTLFALSTIFYISDIINLVLWKIAIISFFALLIQISIFYNFMKDYKNIPILPYLWFVIILGLLVGNMISPDSIKISILNNNSINYTFDFLFSIHFNIFQISMMIYYLYINIKIYNNSRNKKISKFFIIGTLCLYIPLIISNLYVIYELIILRVLFILFSWFGFILSCFVVIKIPRTFIVITSKIFFINIYHKSGILMYSYRFKQNIAENESAIWGNILIGLNYILSEFTEKSSQIDVLQTKNIDLIVHYDDLGFAVVLATNKKNEILQKIMTNFAEIFRQKYYNELVEIQDLNKLINISGFKETTEIIENQFELYL